MLCFHLFIFVNELCSLIVLWDNFKFCIIIINFVFLCMCYKLDFAYLYSFQVDTILSNIIFITFIKYNIQIYNIFKKVSLSPLQILNFVLFVINIL